MYQEQRPSVFAPSFPPGLGSGAALQLVALTALPLERHRSTSAGLPASSPSARPPVCAVYVSDHSAGWDPGWRARCPCRGGAVSGLWVCCGLTCVVVDTRPLRGSGFLTLDRTGGLGSRAHVPVQMSHPGTADAARTSVRNGPVSVTGGWRLAHRALGATRRASQAPGGLLPPAALGSHPGHSGPRRLPALWPCLLRWAWGARCRATVSGPRVVLTSQTRLQPSGPDREQDRETDFAL